MPHMGLVVELQTEDGTAVARVEDPTNILHKLLPSADDNSSVCLRFIDWYGDTVFNRLQMEGFLAEWRRLRKPELSSEAEELLTRIEVLARRCRSEPHFYLKFVGD